MSRKKTTNSDSMQHHICISSNSKHCNGEAEVFFIYSLVNGDRELEGIMRTGRI